jgi:hypothetical protein
MSSLEAPTPVETTRQTPEGLRVPWSMELKLAFLRKPFQIIPHGSRLLTGTYRNDHNQWRRLPCQMQMGT